MSFTIKSISMFLITNAYMLFFGMGTFNIMQKIIELSIISQIILIPIIFLVRNYALVNIIDFGLRNKKDIATQNYRPKEEYKGEFLLNVCSAVCIETLVLFLIHTFYFTFPIPKLNILYEFLWFMLLFLK